MGTDISLCMIVRDEEDTLGRCLSNAREYADEIVIADTGSRDGTPALAKRLADKVCSFEWRDDFAAARNFSFSLASGDYIMWLDADDVVKPSEIGKLLALKRSLRDDRPDTVMCRYESAVDERGETSCVYYRERIMSRSSEPVWQGRVHECVPPRGKIVYSDFTVTHMKTRPSPPGRNLAIYRAAEAAGEPLSPRDKFYFGRELLGAGLIDEAERTLESAALDPEGWYVNRIEACSALAVCRERKGDPEGALAALFLSLALGEPRSGVLSAIASLMRKTGRIGEAAFWYESAMRCRDHSPEGDFDDPRTRSVIPLLGLTECYWLLGKKAESRACHERLLGIAPAHPTVIKNSGFFAAHPKNEEGGT